MSTKVAAQEAIADIFDLLEDIDLPTSLGNYNLPRQNISTISNYMLKRVEEFYAVSRYSPRKVTLENVKDFSTRHLAEENLSDFSNFMAG